MAKPGPKARPIGERFAEKVKRAGNGCLEWQASCNKGGYGNIGSGGPRHRMLNAHRVAWELRFGPIPKGQNVLHRCDNPPCCDTEHLFLGTTLDNCRDMDRKGRRVSVSGERSGNCKLTDVQVAEIRRRHVPGSKWHSNGNSAALAEEFGVSRTYISSLANDKWRKALCR